MIFTLYPSYPYLIHMIADSNTAYDDVTNCHS